MLTHSVLNPRSPLGLAISHLFVAVLIIAGAIVLGIMLVLAYTMVRYRARPGHEGDPPQTYGRTSFEIAWTVIPLLLVITIFGASIETMRLSAPGGDPPPDLTVIGHQWWWEVRYPSGVVTANEVHIPVGKRMYVALKSADVIHSLWVPQLGPKMDLVPGQTNYMWLESSQLGTFEGQCAEFCGAGHAWMLIRVIVQTQAQFNAWQRQQLPLAATPTTKEESLGARFFRRNRSPGVGGAMRLAAGERR
jgi:cytochrome c oxidase subunit 2